MPSRAREYQKKMEQQASWDRLREEPWCPQLSPFRAFGSGAVRVQLIHCPSFTPASFWELTQLDKRWLLYTAEVKDAGLNTIKVQGYDPVEFDSKALEQWFHELCKLELPIRPDDSGMAGCDGEVTQLALYGDLHSECRFQWWSDPPPHWIPMVNIADQMLKAFARFSGTSLSESPGTPDQG